MSIIHVLDNSTINQIAAGEVVERPSAVVKELIENAMDAGATAITAEIKDGGLSLIRITDNGAGIAKEDIPLAFLRHATSKIQTAEDLLSVSSLGFRGEALSSIAAVAQVELITKTPDSLLGYRYIIEGGEEKQLEEIGCPSGTTFLVRNLFYNTPARRKFLKSAVTEAGYVSDLIERLMVSHPSISFKFIMNNQVKLQSSGNNSTKDILYNVYGRDITKELIPLDYHSEGLSITGYIGKPIINRGNRNFENYFINGRYIKSSVIIRAIEDAYKPFLMQHKYPFTSLYYQMDPQNIDVNVHPQKLEIRLKTGEEIYQATYNLIRSALTKNDLIPSVTLQKQESSRPKLQGLPEPFEKQRRNQLEALRMMAPDKDTRPTTSGIDGHKGDRHSELPYEELILNDDKEKNNLTDHGIREGCEQHNPVKHDNGDDRDIRKHGKLGFEEAANHIYSHGKLKAEETTDITNHGNLDIKGTANHTSNHLEFEEANYMNSHEKLNIREEHGYHIPDTGEVTAASDAQTKQLTLFEPEEEVAPFLTKKALDQHKIIGQVFSTYWLVEYDKELYIIDQHAAHEKVLYERIMAAAQTKTYESQMLLPPIVLSLTLREQEVLRQYEETLNRIGYEFEHFGGNEFSVRAVPADLYGLSEKTLLLEFLDSLTEGFNGLSDTVSILEKTASLSCKAAVKANHIFSREEAESLIKELLTLENPYHCPHGRPVIISMSRYELEKKFKRIL